MIGKINKLSSESQSSVNESEEDVKWPVDTSKEVGNRNPEEFPLTFKVPEVVVALNSPEIQSEIIPELGISVVVVVSLLVCSANCPTKDVNLPWNGNHKQIIGVNHCSNINPKNVDEVAPDIFGNISDPVMVHWIKAVC